MTYFSPVIRTLVTVMILFPTLDSIMLLRPFLKRRMTVEVPEHNFWPFLPIVSPFKNNKTYYDLPRHNFWPFIPIVPPIRPEGEPLPTPPTPSIPWVPPTHKPTDYNYDEVLQKSILFYEAQRSGRLPAIRNIAWRGDSALQDQGIFGEDLSGGWYDAGDCVKFGFPMAASTTLLLWGFIEFYDGYEYAGLVNEMYDCVQWPLTYFMKAHPTKFEFYAQVGDPFIDHDYWGRPEDMTMYRPAYRLSPERPGSDVIGETAAALAAGSIVFRTRDPALAGEMLRHSEELFEFAQNYQGLYSESIPSVKEFYPSSQFQDELCWAAAWLYRATGKFTYLDTAEQYYVSKHSWAFNWEDKTDATSLMLFMLTKKEKYRDDIERSLRDWLPGGTVPYTPKGLVFRAKWGSLRFAGNVAFLALVAANADINPSMYRRWAKQQIHYILGDTGRSYVVGFGNNPPTRPHHASSSCNSPPLPCTWDDFSKSTPNSHILYGAVVGGPDKFDHFVDDREDFIQNEVACDYNAGFQSALAGLNQQKYRQVNLI
ncbi:hypothetical protein LOTGIDRAFT_231044 [Lottia gigantea]|uniref:Endoglucanase n=1 Tax=Lottia gigantea TaxID=225164 RepID=V4CBX9_LOTGI|nr:hypothetical protein LOTGIDRAFT_231044 [Lottia gigantea]ESO99349.1 hypothetical protein LOTGIDRAFT_231044 [Lottia gigantea]